MIVLDKEQKETLKQFFKEGFYMIQGLKWTVNQVPKSDDRHLELMSVENVKKQMHSTRAFPSTR